MPITNIKIFPTIGVARLGNSPDEFFVGPEVPGDRSPPTGGYKDAVCRIKRQAARFRLFGYDGAVLQGEVTASDADIQWTVHLANKKSAFRSGDAARAIDPGARTLTGPVQQKLFDTGTFTMPGETPIPVPLGEIRTDNDGRLLVLGGFGQSGSPTKTTISGLYDPEWYDDISDGPVTATVTLHAGGVVVPVTPAWVIVGPPNFAVPVDNPTSLYDRLYDYQGLPVPTTPSFTQDIYPILKSAVNVRGVRNVGVAHGAWDMNILSDPSPAAQAARTAIFDRLENPGGGGSNMPALSGDGSLRTTQYSIMQKWRDGTFTNDWPGAPPPPPDPNGPVTPDGLTRAALENCVGASFSPGIEAGRSLVEAPINYTEDFRLDHGPIEPGFVSRVMSVPWQSDFSACSGSWWPAQRPGQVIPQGDTGYVDWRADVPNAVEMVNNWHTLGFVVEEGANLVEVEKCPASSVNLLTPSINFTNVPQGPGGLPRFTTRAIIFEVISSGSAMNFSYVNGPAHVRLTRMEAGPFPAGPTPPNSSVQLRIWIKYETGTVGESLTDSVRIRNDTTGQEWDIDVSADTVAPKKAAVALALDRSGSMRQDRGDGLGSKVDSLIAAAKIFVDVMPQGDGVGISRYNHDAQKLEDVIELGPITDPFDAGRTTVKSHFNVTELNPSGSTSIGDGIAEARNILDTASGYDVEALVVLSDGKENTSQYIADVASSIDSRTYAIGFGTPENTNIAALQALSGNNGGFLLITGAITGDNVFVLQKYFLQILAGITSAEIITDPQGYLLPNTTHRIPFKVTESETGMDVILLSPLPQWIDFQLETPTGRVVTPQRTETEGGMDYVLSEGVTYYRLSLPVELDPQRLDREGTWHAVLRIADPKKSEHYLRRYSHLSDAGHGNINIPYSLLVNGYSDLRMRVFANQKSFAPGAQALLSASVSQYDRPLAGDSRVWAEITRPDGTVANVDLAHDGDGQYSASYNTTINGIYRARIRAEGTTQMGWPFQRESTQTIPVWHGGDQPPAPSTPEQEDRLVTRCRISGWIVSILIAILVVLAGMPVAGGPILRTVLGTALIIVGLYWLVKCRPLFCRVIRILLQGLGLGAAILGILWLGGIAGFLAAKVLAVTAVTAGVLGIAGLLRGCFKA